MSLKEAKAAVKEHRDKLKAKRGKVCTFGKNGPVGMQVIDPFLPRLKIKSDAYRHWKRSSAPEREKQRRHGSSVGKSQEAMDAGGDLRVEVTGSRNSRFM
jgi:hypothetical protein